MHIARLEHIALSVADMSRSLGFYRDVLGMELVRELDCDGSTSLGTVVGLPGCHAKIAHLMCGDTMLELFEYLDPRGEKIPSNDRQANHGFVHMGLQSSDVRADYAELQAKGIKFLSEPVEFRPDVWIVYFYGPDGEVCELRQTPGGQTGN